MEGGQGENEMGLVPRSVQMVFETLKTYEKSEWEHISVTLSCTEIHIETVRDLLCTTNETK